MSAVTQTDPASVRLPGFSVHFGPTIASATDTQLQDCITKDLAAIAEHVKPLQPTKEGFAPQEWHSLPEHKKGNERAVHNAETRIRLAREELERRATERQQTKEKEIKELTARLEAVLQEGPELVQQIAKAAEEAQPSIEFVNTLVMHLSQFKAASKLAGQYDEVTRGIREASQALNKPMPKLPHLPELPGTDEARHAHSVLAQSPKIPPLVDTSGYSGKHSPAGLAEKLNRLKH